MNELRRAAESFEHIGKVRRGDPDVAKMLAKLYHRMGSVSKAIGNLELFMLEFQMDTDLTHINMLAELYLQQVMIVLIRFWTHFREAKRIVSWLTYSLAHNLGTKLIICSFGAIHRVATLQLLN